MAIRVTHSRAGDAAYIYLREIKPGEARRQEVVGGAGRGEIILDFDRDGRLVGIEVLAAEALLPATLLATAGEDDEPSV